MRLTVAAGALALAATGASAQIGTGSFWIELSADDGQTWHAGTLEVAYTQHQVRVRTVAGWSADAGRWFAGARYDLVWRAVSGGSIDSYAFGVRGEYFRLATQTIAATRFGPAIKVDDQRDTLPPGQGTYGINSGQVVPGFGVNTTDANPTALAEFGFNLDGTPGDREVTCLFLAPPFGNPIDRVFTVYTTSNGQQNAPLTTFTGATLRVLPCPADFNRDGVADFFDYLDFVAAFSAEDPSADINGDAVVDFFDYLDFAAAFDAGCA